MTASASGIENLTVSRPTDTVPTNLRMEMALGAMLKLQKRDYDFWRQAVVLALM